jgi:hypothetical protein
VADQPYGRRIMGPRFPLRDVRVRLDGRWVVAVTFKDGDVYVKQGRLWHDEHDGVTHC